jgi:ribosomal protein L11 methyltransferase
MIKAYLEIEENLLDELEEILYEFAPHNWILYFNHSKNCTKLEGFFKNSHAAIEDFKRITGTTNLKHLTCLLFENVYEDDWKNAYKKHFQPWRVDNFHWVPIWYKDNYSMPADHLKLYLDPGMAFGTGTHETTKLCLQTIVDLYPKVPREFKQSFLDVGCGSGILAITASILGFREIDAIDNDPLAIKVSQENSLLNNIDNVHLENIGINTHNTIKKYDFVVANIQADILQNNAEQFIKLLNKKAYLILSGILSTESEKLKCYYERLFTMNDFNFTYDNKIMNEWSLTIFQIV